MMTVKYNFSGGPGALPSSVLAQLSQAVTALDETGLSLLGMSHRSKWFRAVIDEAEQTLRQLAGIPADYHILFLQGGASLQFSMVAMTLLRGSRHAADYLETGYWSAKAIPEARLEGDVRLAWSGREDGFRQLPRGADLQLSADAPYLHYVSNETVEGLQFHWLPGLPAVPRICDMSSDFLSRPVNVADFKLIYAHAQKNIGPAGVTIAVVHRDIAERCSASLPSILNYKKHVESGSIYNTPPVFAIYAVLLVLRWLRDEIGGLEAMDGINRAKAAALYAALDHSGSFYKPHAALADRSLMNVSFRLPTADLDALFVAEAEKAGLCGLDGHRSVGGIRASLYNAVSPAAVDVLGEFLGWFCSRFG